MNRRQLIKFFGLSFVLCTAAGAGALWLVQPQAGVRVNVRWNAGVGGAERAALERRFALADGALLQGTTWQYSLRDDSRANIQALVREPRAADTDYLDREAFRPTSPPPGVIRRIGPASLASGLVASLLLLAVQALRRRTLVLSPRVFAAVLGAAPLLLVIALILTIVLAFRAG
jgi:hypothetical protein